jgi:DNA integrity scanning protein DisA with diadenylate cyclase activity
VHELAARRIGATLIWRPAGTDIPRHRHEPLIRNAPRLRLDHAGEAAALAQALAQTDGAALFDRDTALIGLGIRLAPSSEAEQTVGPLRGMRHTSARRYSHDDPDAIVVVVSESGPVTIMYRGDAFTTIDRGDEKIG